MFFTLSSASSCHPLKFILIMTITLFDRSWRSQPALRHALFDCLSSLVQSGCLLEHGVHGKWSGRYLLWRKYFSKSDQNLSVDLNDNVNDVQINSLQHHPDQADRESVQYEDPEIRAYHEWHGRVSCYWWYGGEPEDWQWGSFGYASGSRSETRSWEKQEITGWSILRADMLTRGHVCWNVATVPSWVGYKYWKHETQRIWNTAVAWKHSGCMVEIGWSISTVTWRRSVAESDVQRRHVQRQREYLWGSPPSAEWEAPVESWDEKREMFVKTDKSTTKSVSRGCGQGDCNCGGRVWCSVWNLARLSKCLTIKESPARLNCAGWNWSWMRIWLMTKRCCSSLSATGLGWAMTV